jgi:WD40 repeat protein
VGVIRWDAATGKEDLFRRLPKAEIDFVRLSPDGTLLAFGLSGRARLAEVAAPAKQGQALSRIRLAQSRLVFLPAGGVALGSLKEPLLLRTVGPESPLTPEPPVLQAPLRPATLAVSADGRRLAAGGAGQLRLVRVWDLASGKLLHTLRKGRPPVVSLALSPDGKMLACAARGRNSVQIIDLTTGQGLRFFRKHRQTLSDVTFSPDGKLVASCAFGEGLVRLWDPRTGTETKVLPLAPPGGSVLGVLFAPDGRHLATRNADGTAYIVRITPLPH